MPLKDFYQHTPRQFLNYLKGVRFRESENYKNSMLTMRWGAFFTVLPHHDSNKNGKLTPEKLMQFPWETQQEHESKKQDTQGAREYWKRVDESKAKA
jgi:hypothetical protein